MPVTPNSSSFLRSLLMWLSTVRSSASLSGKQLANSSARLKTRLGARAVVAGDTLVAIEGVAEGTAVVAGRMGSLREGTPVRMQGAPAAPAAAASPASRPAP